MKAYLFLKIITYNRFALLFLLCINSSIKLFSEKTQNTFMPHWAVITVPVIDMSISFPAPENLPAAPNEKNCLRAHQGLYNELVYCIAQKGDSIKIACPNIIYGFDPKTKKPLSCFWTHTKNLLGSVNKF